jgi:hypothetical protein
MTVADYHHTQPVDRHYALGVGEDSSEGQVIG